jgi:hypothetical protein
MTLRYPYEVRNEADYRSRPFPARGVSIRRADQLPNYDGVKNDSIVP